LGQALRPDCTIAARKIESVGSRFFVEVPFRDRPFRVEPHADRGMRPRVSLEHVAATATAARAHGIQSTETPFDKLNVELVQNAAALRYQTWYVRVPGAVMLPLTDKLGSPACGTCDAPAALVTDFKRTMLPPAQRNPSPNTVPRPAATCVVPWKYSAELFGIPLPRSASVSIAMLEEPVAVSRAPVGSTLLAQPRPAPPTFPHGHAVAVPSPEQKVVPVICAPGKIAIQPPGGCG
jgi:hypothetical protein